MPCEAYLRQGFAIFQSKSKIKHLLHAFRILIYSGYHCLVPLQRRSSPFSPVFRKYNNLVKDVWQALCRLSAYSNKIDSQPHRWRPIGFECTSPSTRKREKRSKTPQQLQNFLSTIRENERYQNSKKYKTSCDENINVNTNR